MAGVGFSFFYGFVGTFASGHGLGNIYPITAGLSLINYQNGKMAACPETICKGLLNQIHKKFIKWRLFFIPGKFLLPLNGINYK